MIGVTTNRVEYAGNNSTVTAYVIPFRYDAAAWVRVVRVDASGVVTDLEQVTHYTLAGNGATTTGTFRTVAAIPASSTLRVYREAPGTQTLDLEPNSPLPAASLEAQLDRLAMAAADRVTARAMEARIRDIELTPGPAGDIGLTGTSTGGNGVADAGKVVKFAANGGLYAAVADEYALDGLSTDGIGASGSSTNGVGVNAFSENTLGLSASSSTGIGLNTYTETGTHHATFGNTGIGQSFVARLKGAFGWIRGAFTGRIHPPDTLTADRTWTLPDMTGTLVTADGTQTLTNKSISVGQITGLGTAATTASTAYAGSNQTPILENIEGLNRAFDDFMRFDTDTLASPFRLTLTGFADSMPGNAGAWTAQELQRIYGVGMLFTPELGQSWNGAAATLGGGATADTTTFSRVPSACEINLPAGGSYAITTPDISQNPLAAVYRPGGGLTEDRLNANSNVIPLPRGIRSVRVFYVKLPSAGSITATLTQNQFSTVTSGAVSANAAEALGTIDLTPNDFFAPITLNVSASGGVVRFIGAVFYSGSGVGYWSSARGATKMDDQLTGLRSGAWNQVYKDLCASLNTSFVLHCQRASDAGTEANNYAANYQTFFDAYQEQGLGQVVFEEPHRDTENALTTATINATLRSLCATERIAFVRSQRIVLAGSTTALGWGDGDNIHRDSREWRYVSGVFLNQVGNFRSAHSRHGGAGLSTGQLASERFFSGALSRARRTDLIGRTGIDFASKTWSGSGNANPSIDSDLGFRFAAAASVVGHQAAWFGRVSGGSSQLETETHDVVITGIGHRNMILTAGGGMSAGLIFGHQSALTPATNGIGTITQRSYGLEFQHGTDIGSGLAATEYVRIWAHNGTAMTYSRWVLPSISGTPSGTGMSFILRWSRVDGILTLWMNGNSLSLFPRVSLPVPAFQSASTLENNILGYMRTTGTGAGVAGKMQWLQLSCEFGNLEAPYGF